MERTELTRLLAEGLVVEGSVPILEVLEVEPQLMVPVSEPSMTPLHLPTYQIRLARWEAGFGPNLHGGREFVAALKGLDQLASVLIIDGVETDYILLIDAARERVLASLAVDERVTPSAGKGAADDGYVHDSRPG